MAASAQRVFEEWPVAAAHLAEMTSTMAIGVPAMPGRTMPTKPCLMKELKTTISERLGRTKWPARRWNQRGEPAPFALSAVEQLGNQIAESRTGSVVRKRHRVAQIPKGGRFFLNRRLFAFIQIS